LDRKAIGAFLVVALALGGCGKKREVIVGSKNFTEQLILGEIISQQIERRLHIPVKRQLNLGGTLLAHQALTNSQIDLYPEYTGTAYMTMLHRSGVTDPATVLDQVRGDYASSFHLKWLDPLGFNDSFAIAVRGELARQMKLDTISDAEKSKRRWALGSGYEFLERPDGFRALEATYPDMQWNGAPKTMDLGLLYKALEQGQVEMVAGNTTDAALATGAQKVLKDDRHAFPPYQASIVVRYDTLDRFPGLEKALSELSGKISEEAMQKMNGEVDVQHRPPADVAAEFLKTLP
jgi:glycine betaine/choline ABC-type transport system substrate-binding protein